MENSVVKKAFWALSPEDTLETLKSRRSGLSAKEAKKRTSQFGKNELTDKGRISRFSIFLNQFKNPLIIVLIIAGAATLFLKLFIDASVIFIAVAINTGLGFYQENRAEEALARLKTYLKERARVIRNGKEREVAVSEVMPGDIVHLTSGSRIAADARIISESDLHIDESILTGESLPVSKNPETLARDAELPDRKNMVFGGTFVTGGSAIAVVTATGHDTEIGKIATLVTETTTEKTPLQKTLTRFAWVVTALISVVIAGIFILGIFRGQELLDMFLVAVAMAVGSIPEGLPIALTVILAIGVERLAKRKGVVRRLLAAETLGSTTLVLTDKTGTLTQAKMQLDNIIRTEDIDEASDPQHTAVQSPEDLTEGKISILKSAILNTDVVVENPDAPPDDWRLLGDTMEKTLVRSAAQYGIDTQKFLDEKKPVEVLPFSSKYKFSASFVRHTENGGNSLVFLGAPEVLLEKSNIRGKKKNEIERRIDNLAGAGKRLLGVAVKPVGEEEEFENIDPDDIDNLEFNGIITFHDPVRKEVASAMEKVRGFGTDIVMVTGDLKGTAISVANELGWNVKERNVVSGSELRKMSDEELKSELSDIKIFARVSPEDKVRIAKMFQEAGETVAMTGDGVNDAPSLKAVDIGIAVGSGTDVAKEVADLVILDDNFETIVAAIEEGKKILSNIKKSIIFLLSDSWDEILLIGGSLILAIPIPLTALQILYVNIFSDSLPAVSFAFEKEYEPIPAKEQQKRGHIFDKEVKVLILGVGTLFSALLFGLYWFFLQLGFETEVVRTFIFATFGIYTIFLGFSLRNLRKSIFSYSMWGNKVFLAGFALSAILTAAAIYLPFLQNVLDTVALSLPWILLVFGVSFLNMAGFELTKWIFRRKYDG